MSGMVDGPLGPEHRDPACVIAPDCGGIASFIGTVRNEHVGKGVTHLVYDCHRSMAEATIPRLIAELTEQAEDTVRIAIWHGLGPMDVGDCAVAIHVASPHRLCAFDTCRAAIEAIKRDLPVWKKEFYDDGSAQWLHGS